MIDAPNSLFAADLAQTVIACLPARTDLTISPLLQQLGCTRLERDSRIREYRTERAEQPAAGHEALIRTTLIDAMRSHLASPTRYYYFDGVSIFDGLVRNHRWTQCLHHAGDAYCFAEILMRTSMVMRDTHEIQPYYRAEVLRSLNEVLELWLQPDDPFDEVPGAEEMARLFFGDAWYEFVLGPAKILADDLPLYIRETRPPFVHSLLRVKQDTNVQIFPLPEMGAP